VTRASWMPGLGRHARWLRIRWLVVWGRRCRARGHYPAAARLLTRALHLAAECRLAPHRLAVLLNDVGLVYKATAQYDRARRHYLRALELAELDGVPRPLFRATLYHNLGGIEHARHAHAAGEPFARAAAALREAELGARHPDVAADLVALGAILVGLRRFEEAEALYLHALAVFEARYGPGHAEVASTLGNLGALATEGGRHHDAEHCLRRALAIQEALLGPSHPDVAVCLNNLAVALRRQQRPSEALPLYERALVILLRSSGEHHPSVRSCRASHARALAEVVDHGSSVGTLPPAISLPRAGTPPPPAAAG